MRIENLQNENRKYAKSIGNFHVLEYVQDASVSPMNAMNEYFMSKMNVRRRQVVIDIDKDHSAVIPVSYTHLLLLFLSPVITSVGSIWSSSISDFSAKLN